MPDDFQDPFAANLWGAPPAPVKDAPRKEGARAPGDAFSGGVSDYISVKASPPLHIPAIGFGEDDRPACTDDVVAALFLLMRGEKGVTDGEANDGRDRYDEGDLWKLPGRDGSRRHYRLPNFRSRLTTLRRICVERGEDKVGGLWRDEAKEPRYILHRADKATSGRTKPFSRHYLSVRGAELLMGWVMEQPGVGENLGVRREFGG